MRQEGFSLIEMLAALAILALAGLAMLNMMQVTTRNAAAVESRSLAMLAAENVINTELLRAEELDAQTGEYALAGMTFDWSLRVENTTDRELQRVVISVSDAETGQDLARLETYQRRRR